MRGLRAEFECRNQTKKNRPSDAKHAFECCTAPASLVKYIESGADALVRDGPLVRLTLADHPTWRTSSAKTIARHCLSRSMAALHREWQWPRNRSASDPA